MTFKIPTELDKRIASVASDLATLADEMQTEFDNKSEKWQESDAADEVDGWIETLGEMADALENLGSRP